ncbi:MAG: hypothetical protein U0103_02895 [Candidatus Obscuribacterales bacterium]
MSEAPDGPSPPPDSGTPEPVEPRAQPSQSSSVSNATSNADAAERRVARTMLDISHIPKKSNRRVAKTLLEQAVPSPDMHDSERADVSSAVSPGYAIAQDSKTSVNPRKFKRISRTMMELDVQGLVEKAALTAPSTSPSQPATQSGESVTQPGEPVTQPGKPVTQPTKSVSTRYVAKTMLDHSLLFQAVSQSANRLEHKAAEIAKERALAPVELIEPIVADGKVSGCKWSWTEVSNRKERYRACGVCQTAIYDFEGLEHEEAAAIVFQRENLKKPKFYLRTDGKFMTRQCPREVSRKLRMISLSALGVISLLSAILLTVLLGQSSKFEPVSSIPPDESGVNQSIQSNQGSAATSKESSSSTSNGTSSTSGMLLPSTTSTALPPGMFHYENGKVTRGAVRSSSQEAPAAPSNAGAPGESEPMWQETSK